MDRDDLSRLFVSCDKDGNGHLSKDEFWNLCSELNLSKKEFRELFNAVDVNRDGKIQLEEFINKFHVVADLYLDSIEEYNDVTDNSIDSQSDLNGSRRGLVTSTPKQRPRDGASWDGFVEQLGHIMYALPSYERIQELYRVVEEKDPRMLAGLEKMLQHIFKDVEHLQSSVTELQASVARVKEQGEVQLSLLEEEMETQVRLKEERARFDTREECEKKSNEEREKYERQISQLQEAVDRLKQVDEKLSTSSPYEKEMEKLREKIRDITTHNSTLRTRVNESETTVALLRSEISSLKVEMQEKNLDYGRENEAVTMALSENENMSRQVNALFSENRRLLDSNDDLRGVLDTNYATFRRISSRLSKSPAASVHEDVSSGMGRNGMMSGRSSRNSFLDIEALAECDPGLKRVTSFDGGIKHMTSYDPDDDTEADISLKSSLDAPIRINYAYERDSGISTIKDDPDSESEFDRLPASATRFPVNMLSSRTSVSMKEKRNSRRSRSKNRKKIISDDLTPDDVTDDDVYEHTKSRSVAGLHKKVVTPELPGRSGKLYKVILCGDASVGKSSFILRLCKNEFRKHTRATLGVDFHMKTIRLSADRSISLQLWDTAGQERFRSIATSYFRNVDGVILLYDVTNPESFLNVRDWMETISESAPAGSPVLICGNKLDLRSESDEERMVYQADGAQLAASYGVLFMETSAYNGANVLAAVTSLASHLPDNVIDKSDTTSIKSLSTSKPVKCC
ncbi:unnamed protein product [Clavelina lepadiformis]|uniref:EF-hand domain-containing protein n=3 Tax=Clavelina lepadiformis TaxID=159417 RepID=A0ABP0FV92_CLALP